MTASFRVSLVLALMVAATSTLMSQSATSLWFVQASAGAGGYDNGPFSRRLQQIERTPRDTENNPLVYNSTTYANVGYTLGGSFGLVINGTVMLGLSGEKLLPQTVESVTSPGVARDQYVLDGWGGGIDIGYVMLNESATIVYPFINVGYHGYTLVYHNNQSIAIPFFEGALVPAGTTQTYTGAAPRAAIGIGLNSFIGTQNVGGFEFGARAAYGQMFARPEWEQDGEVVNNGGLTPAYNAFTFSIAIGYGG